MARRFMSRRHQCHSPFRSRCMASMRLMPAATGRSYAVRTPTCRKYVTISWASRLILDVSRSANTQHRHTSGRMILRGHANRCTKGRRSTLRVKELRKIQRPTLVFYTTSEKQFSQPAGFVAHEHSPKYMGSLQARWAPAIRFTGQAELRDLRNQAGGLQFSHSLHSLIISFPNQASAYSGLL